MTGCPHPPPPYFKKTWMTANQNVSHFSTQPEGGAESREETPLTPTHHVPLTEFTGLSREIPGSEPQRNQAAVRV